VIPGGAPRARARQNLPPAPDSECRAAADVVDVAVRAKDRLQSEPWHQGVVERDALLKPARTQDDVGNPLISTQSLSQPQSVPSSVR